MRQLVALACTLMPTSTELSVVPLPHPHPLSILDTASRFLLAHEDEAILDAMNARVLWDYF